MTQLCVLGAFLMVAGLFFIFKIDPIEFIDLLTKPMQRRRALKDRVDKIAGKKPGFFRQQIINIKEMLASANMGGNIRKYQLASLLLAVTGFLIGTAIDNIMAAVVLALGLAIMPIIYIQLKTGEYIRSLNESIETALSVVTSSYVQSGDLIDAVRSSLKAIPAPLDDVFKKFLVEVEMIDSNVVQALYNMSHRINRRHFKEWCSAAIQCQSDRELRYAMPGIVERLSEYRQIQMETDTAMRRMYTEYGLMVVIILGCIPIMAMMMPGWFDALMNTLVGKITLAVVLLAIFLCTIGVVQSNRPIEVD
jgi:tight adherence protein B